MFLYAVLNENGVCIGFSSLSGEMLREDHIPVESMDEDLLYRKFEEGEWSQEKYVPDHGAIELSRMEAVEQELEQAKQKNAELQQQNIDTMLALTEMFEEIIRLKAQNLELE